MRQQRVRKVKLSKASILVFTTIQKVVGAIFSFCVIFFSIVIEYAITMLTHRPIRISPLGVLIRVEMEDMDIARMGTDRLDNMLWKYPMEGGGNCDGY